MFDSFPTCVPIEVYVFGLAVAFILGGIAGCIIFGSKPPNQSA